MPHINPNRRRPGKAWKPAAAVALVLLPASIGLAACGGSSSSSTATTTANAAAATSSGTTSPGTTSPGTTSPGTTSPGTGSPGTGSGPTGARAGRFKALGECLQKNGITLPKRTPGQRPYGGLLGGAGGTQLPAGVTRAQYEAAVKKCGGAGFVGAGGRIRNNPAFKVAVTKFAACMREDGVNVPEPNTSGNGPVFNSKGLDTTSLQFQHAEIKCRTDLFGAFRRGGATGGPPAGPPPGTGGETSTGG